MDGPALLLRAYRALVWAARPWLLRKLRRRGRQEPLYLHAVHQRWGRYDESERQQAAAHAGQWVWLHAVSLGETRAAAVLIAALRAADPSMHLLLTSGTATGWAEAQRWLREGDMHVWLPWDSDAAVTSFVQTFRPHLGLLLETEVWPNVLRVCHDAGIPVVLANARLSEHTLRQSLRLQAVARRVYGWLAAAYAQTQADAQRLQQLGADPVLVTGNLKFDAQPDPQLLAEGRTWRRRLLPAGRRVALFASSRDGEEAMWLRAMAALTDAQRRAVQWLIVPRHPQRFDAVARLLEQAGWRVLRRSQWTVAAAAAAAGSVDASAAELPPTVWLGDSLGEMALYYAMADVALLGGSFEPLGGQNLIEACACGCPVLMGPHTFNFAEASAQAEAAGAALRCADLDAAVTLALTLLGAGEPVSQMQSELDERRRAALDFAAAHRGAAERTVSDLIQRGWLRGSQERHPEQSARS